MKPAVRILGALLALIGLSWGLQAQAPQSGAADVQVQLGDLFLANGRYVDSQAAYRRALGSSDTELSLRAGAGLAVALLRTGDFREALEVSTGLSSRGPSDPSLASLRGDALWSNGRFEEAEAAYDSALAASPEQPRALHGRARSLAARNRLTDALSDALTNRRAQPAERRISSHRRLHSRAPWAIRRCGACAGELHRTAAGQGTQRESGLGPRRDPVLAVIQGPSAFRHRRAADHLVVDRSGQDS